MGKLDETLDFKIEKNIPVPPQGVANKYTQILDKMDFGDSIKVTNKMKDRIMAHVYSFRRILKEKYQTRKVDKEYYRIWKMKK